MNSKLESKSMISSVSLKAAVMIAAFALILACVMMVPDVNADDESSVSSDNTGVAIVNGTSYQTVDAAIDAASEGGTVYITADVSEALVVDKSITLAGINSTPILSYNSDGVPTAPNSRSEYNLSGTITVTGSDVTIAGLKITNLISVKTNCDSFTLTNNHIVGTNKISSNVCSVYIESSSVYININGNYWGANANAYNLIEQSSGASLKEESIITQNYFAEDSCSHNEITITQVENDITIDRNYFGYSGAGIRFGGVLQTSDVESVVYNITNNVLAKTSQDQWGGLITLQPFGSTWKFSQVTINITNNSIPSYTDNVFYTYGFAADDHVNVYVNAQSVDQIPRYSPIIIVEDKGYYSIEYAASSINNTFTGTINTENVYVDGHLEGEKAISVTISNSEISAVTVNNNSVQAYSIMNGDVVTADNADTMMFYSNLSVANASGYEYTIIVQNAFDSSNSTVIVRPTIDNGDYVVNIDSNTVNQISGNIFTVKIESGMTPASSIQMKIDSEIVNMMTEGGKSLVIDDEGDVRITLDSSTISKIATESGASVTWSNTSDDIGYGFQTPEAIDFINSLSTEFKPVVFNIDVGENRTGLDIDFEVMYEVPAGYIPIVWYVSDDGTREQFDASYSNGFITMNTTHCSGYVFTASPAGDDDSTPGTTPGTGVDDDESLPPFIPQQPVGDDNTTLYIACCAAAAVVALLAIIIVMGERKR